MKPTAFKFATFLGFLLLILSIVLLVVNPKAQGNLPKGFFTPVIAFEFIQTSGELTQFFKVSQVTQYETTMLTGNYIDYGFMVLYTLFLLAVAIGIQRISGVNAMWVAILLCFTALLGDAMENIQIHQLIKHHRSADLQHPLYLLNIFTWLKWGSIASVFLLFSPHFLKGTLFSKLTGLCCWICFGLCGAAFFQHGIINEIFTASVVLVFLLLVIYVATFTTTKSLL